MNRRIGLFGGTFDPPHDGHVSVAHHALTQLDLDEVRWLPVGNPTHKSRADLSDVAHRIAMVEMMFGDTVNRVPFVLDRTDAERDPPHYTATLLPLIRQKYRTADLWLIIGTDSLREFHTWYQPDTILSHCRLAVYPRPGVEVDWDALAYIPQLRARVDLLEGIENSVSSTELREAIRQKKIGRQLPQRLIQYIAFNDLYQIT